MIPTTCDNCKELPRQCGILYKDDISIYLCSACACSFLQAPESGKNKITWLVQEKKRIREQFCECCGQKKI